mgnify:CR=1 FL=1|jgi:hypothetical protein
MKQMNKQSQSLEPKLRSSNPLTYKPGQAYLNNFAAAAKIGETTELNEFINMPILPVATIAINNIKSIKQGINEQAA